MMEMLPDATPLVRGVKIRFNDVLWPGSIVVGRDIPSRWNSELVVFTEERVTLDPSAVRVTVRVLLVPMVTLPKFKSVALGVNWPAEMPVPFDEATGAGARVTGAGEVLGKVSHVPHPRGRLGQYVRRLVSLCASFPLQRHSSAQADPDEPFLMGRP
jgi:hypothetical protein